MAGALALGHMEVVDLLQDRRGPGVAKKILGPGFLQMSSKHPYFVGINLKDCPRP